MTPAPAIATLAPQIGKLVRLLSSDKDGEVIAAVRALDRVLKAHKLDFHDLALALCPAGTPVRHRAGDWHDTLAFCAANMDRCAPRERAFLRSIAKWRGELSPRQRDWLEAIADRLADGAR